MITYITPTPISLVIKHLENWIMELIYTKQFLLNLKNFRYLAVLDYMTKQRIKCLNINKKFRSKRGNRRNRHGAKSPLRSWNRNSGDTLKSIETNTSQHTVHPLLIPICLTECEIPLQQSYKSNICLKFLPLIFLS